MLKFKKIIRSIKKRHPELSKEEITQLVCDYLESNLGDILAPLEVPHKKSLTSRFILARCPKKFREHRLNAENETRELITILELARTHRIKRSSLVTSTDLTTSITKLEQDFTTLKATALSAEDSLLGLKSSRDTQTEDKTSKRLKRLLSRAENGKD